MAAGGCRSEELKIAVDGCRLPYFVANQAAPKAWTWSGTERRAYLRSMTEPEPGPVPDLLGELRGGRFPYEFARVIAGDPTSQRTAHYALQRLLGAGEAEAVANLILIGGRHVLGLYAQLSLSQQAAALEKLREMTPGERDEAATSPCRFLAP